MRASTLDRLLSLLGDVNGLGDLEAFRSGLLNALQHAVPSRFASYNEVAPDGVHAFSEPELPPEAPSRWAALADQHPVLVHMQRTRDGRPRRISDHLNADAFHSTELYQRFYGPLGIESQVAFGLPAAAPTVIGVALSRDERDFSDEDVELLARARPHLIQAYRAAQAVTERERVLAAFERGLESVGRLAVAVTREGEIVHGSERARAAVAASAPDGRRVLRGPTPGDLDVVLLDAQDGGLTVERLRTLGLTAREAEALRWIALGRTGPDAADAMGIAPRTVAKHLQSVYAKLGVTTRSEAAKTAWAAVGT
ncbi:helix-turn-helix transcriptional regulator [Solirubrobacter phytolaccae]|uniref:Helix-turn-helix transcriptional regulator n=1 Tax=Solirubrobacter phytolaccae TaxID=1404360 RepID=A0A9X3N6B1_9ACTN|nr:helix-turn-helix transcriptional regulator [Solirubrobacter phytolaccae]MDA0180419.1 helix-turn-helix transcriptional regulator [Solirubrobacter phytolaccae]